MLTHVILRRRRPSGRSGLLCRPQIGSVAEDRRIGVVSPDAAGTFYGVVPAPDGTADDTASAARRDALRAVRQPLASHAETRAAVFEAGSVSQRRIVERTEGLRGWVRSDPAAQDGTLALDPIGLAILRAAPGDAVGIRRVRALPA